MFFFYIFVGLTLVLTLVPVEFETPSSSVGKILITRHRYTLHTNPIGKSNWLRKKEAKNFLFRFDDEKT